MGRKLKPCPFCGGEAVLVHATQSAGRLTSAYVWCTECGCRTATLQPNDALEEWNRRTVDVYALHGVVDELECEYLTTNDTKGINDANKALAKRIKKAAGL